jgi:hypothetical protein
MYETGAGHGIDRFLAYNRPFICRFSADNRPILADKFIGRLSGNLSADNSAVFRQIIGR